MHSSNDTYINPINPTYGELFEQELNGYILAVPPYQRPYVWTKKKVETLMNDWLEYLESPDANGKLVNVNVFLSLQVLILLMPQI